MHNILFLLLFILISCGYPDIDTVPEFDSLKITMEEKLDKCKINNDLKIKQDDCFEELRKIINRL